MSGHRWEVSIKQGEEGMEGKTFQEEERTYSHLQGKKEYSVLGWSKWFSHQEHMLCWDLGLEDTVGELAGDMASEIGQSWLTRGLAYHTKKYL